MRRALLCFPLAACAPGSVVWDATTGDDVGGDVAIALLSLGYAAEDDRALLDVPHVTGSTLEMNVLDEHNGAVSRWTVKSLAPEVCTVTTGTTRNGQLPVTLSFTGQGTTEVLVVDENDVVVDWQPIAVRDVVGADVRVYDVLRLGESVPIETLHVVGGSEGSLVVNWFGANGEALGGSGLLSATSPAPEIVLEAQSSDDSYETLGVWVDPGLASGETSIELLALGTSVRALPVVVHDREEITEILLLDSTSVDEDGATGGYVRAQVLAGADEIFGAMVTWSVDGEEVGEGTWARLAGENEDDLHEITACRGRLCTTETLPGTITSVEDAFAELPCGCNVAPGLPSAGLIAAIIAARRRRQA
ncbi:MAG: hypothetical protein FJ090_10715 [Deltaproteobacteria bacterium]|nr:hypothetical protein [Deltaproteobacteria bacterium]